MATSKLLHKLSMGTIAVAFIFIGTIKIERADAAVVSFVENPTQNLTNWTNSINKLNGVINSNINFDTHPTGLLQKDFYLPSDGVTLISSGDVNNVRFGQGPGQANVSTEPLSSGEGLHPASNYLLDDQSSSSLTISFNYRVIGVGLSVIDYYNPYFPDDNPLTIEAFTGANATGISLGKFSSVAFNFQPNNTYFMGITSTDENIGSLVFRGVNNNLADVTGIDNIVFARRSSEPVPEPSTIMSLLTAAGFGLALRCKQKRQQKDTIKA